MKHKKLFITLVAVATTIVALAVFLISWYTADRYDDFAEFRREFVIPGLDDGATPQGLGSWYDKEGNTVTSRTFFTSAYFSGGKPSRIYVTKTDPEGKTLSEGYFTFTVDGKPHTGHCGGVAAGGRSVATTKIWIASDSKVYVFNYADAVKAAETNGSVEAEASFDPMCNASFCYYYEGANGDDKLYVGEFYRKGNYETDSSHHLEFTGNNGKKYKNYAFVCSFDVIQSNENHEDCKKYGLVMTQHPHNSSGDPSAALNNRASGKKNLPYVDRIYSIPEQVQGFARIKANSSSGTPAAFVLSTSWGLSNSDIKYYLESAQSGAVGVDKTSGYLSDGFKLCYDGDDSYYDRVTTYFLYPEDQTRTYSIPSMSEGLTTVGNRVFVLFENACNKYKVFVREQVKHVMSFRPKS